MTRPKYTEQISDYIEPSQDGPVVKQQVEYQFGIPGLQDDKGHGIYFRDTLREDWADRSKEERLAEAEARYDRWVETVNAATDPAVPTLTALREEVRNNEQALRDQQRTLLDSRDRLTLAEENQPIATAVNDGPWSDPDTWDTGVVPDPDTRAVIPGDVTVAIDIGVTVTASTTEPVPPDEG